MTIRIDPDGTVTHIDGDVLTAARAEFAQTTVVTCQAPILPGGIWVGVIDDFGAQDQPYNPKAWALYGRSPIFGAMFFGADGQADGSGFVPEFLAEIISLPLDEWNLPEQVLTVLTTEPERPDMLGRRPVDDDAFSDDPSAAGQYDKDSP